MKRILIVIMVILMNIVIFADTITTKSGEELTGEIKTMTDELIILKTSFGEITVYRINIAKIEMTNQMQNNHYFGPQKNEVVTEVVNKEQQAEIKAASLFNSYKALKNTSIGLFIPGSILLGVGAAASVPFFYIAANLIVDSYFYDENYVRNNLIGYGLAFSIGLGLPGLIMMIVSACLLGSSNTYFEKIKYLTSSIIIGYNDGPVVGVKFKM